MTTELTMLAWTIVLALVHIFAAVAVRTRQYGTAWNMGPRDEAVPPPTPLAGRLDRAQANLFETLPLFAAAVLIAHAAGVHTARTMLGAQLYFWARVAYLPLYAAGVPVVRTLAFATSVAGLLLIVTAVL
ncbi:MAG: MAPEG family protein [Sphingomonadaceae bacterium]|nr:MAPEG family protein [Sphingomonadaceae bacterium]